MGTRTISSQIALPMLEVAPSVVHEAKIREAYVNDGVTPISARVALELKYASLLTPTNEFNRKIVSYQANKNARLHNWLKYKEGFSAQLVETLISKFGIQQGQKILEPFAGSATTLLVASGLGIDALGIELLPVCHLAWEAKSNYRRYDLAELRQALTWLQQTPAECSDKKFPHLVITDSAFPSGQEEKLMWYAEQFAAQPFSELTKLLLQLVLMSVLEDISYTRKDGQYLRWDSRSEKAQQRDAKRLEKNKPPYKRFDKGKILDVTEALIRALSEVIRDIESLKQDAPTGQQELIAGTVLEVLPTLEADQFDAIITSPPYCNRYDYTRTYALELAFLGVGEDDLRNLRQELLSCTVENRPKITRLQDYYSSIDRSDDFRKVMGIINSNQPLQEIFTALRAREEKGELNNAGVVRMVEGYFTELAFTIFEMCRVCRSGAQLAVVNDNVRYGGEMIPVDLLMTDLAESFGFQAETVYVLPQRKGNSSQQMGKYGREANRKSIEIWRKP